MTLKEKAVEYVERNYDGNDGRLKNFILVSFMDGYEQAKREDAEQIEKQKEINKDYVDETEALKGQIEKMKCCKNCANSLHGERGENGRCEECGDKGKLNEWELAE